jgi:hypothetical protein
MPLEFKSGEIFARSQNFGSERGIRHRRQLPKDAEDV